MIEDSKSQQRDTAPVQDVQDSKDNTATTINDSNSALSMLSADDHSSIKDKWASSTTNAEQNGHLPGLSLQDSSDNKNSGNADAKKGESSDKKENTSDKKGFDSDKKGDEATSPFNTGKGNDHSEKIHSSKMYDGNSVRVDQETLMNNVKVVAEVAKSKGVDPTTAVASMLVESGGDNKVVGDHGTSFGLFQLHKGGELGNLSKEQASNPHTNACVALSEFARIQHKHGNPGKLAAAAQRPANPEKYAQKVNAMLPNARRMLEFADV